MLNGYDLPQTSSLQEDPHPNFSEGPQAAQNISRMCPPAFRGVGPAPCRGCRNRAVRLWRPATSDLPPCRRRLVSLTLPPSREWCHLDAVTNTQKATLALRYGLLKVFLHDICCFFDGHHIACRMEAPSCSLNNIIYSLQRRIFSSTSHSLPKLQIFPHLTYLFKLYFHQPFNTSRFRGCCFSTCVTKMPRNTNHTLRNFTSKNDLTETRFDFHRIEYQIFSEKI